MNGPTSTSWARMQRSLWPSQSAAAPKTVGHSRKASTCHVEIPKQLCRLALIILPSLILTTAALADEDEKAYPGAGCQPLNSTDPVQRDIDGKMFNVGKEIQTWICPVVKDISSGSHSPEFARITVIGNLQCFLHSRGPNGDQKKFASSDTTIPAAAPNTAVRLQYGSGDNDVPVSAGSGYYYFVCDVPGTGTQGKDPQSGVVTYLVNENDDED